MHLMSQGGRMMGIARESDEILFPNDSDMVLFRNIDL